MDDTHVTIERQYLESYEWRAESFTRGQALVDLLGLAQTKDCKIKIRGIEVELKRGQTGVSRETLKKRWGWKARDTVKRFLNDLENRHQIRQQVSNVITVIEIVNYGGSSKSESPPESPPKKQPRNSVEKPAKEARVFSPDAEKMFAFFCKERQVKPKSAAVEVKWKDAIRLTIDLDKRDKAEMCRLIRWVSQDIEEPRPGSTWSGWRDQIRAPATFRAKYETLLERSKVARRATGAPAVAPKPFRAPTGAERLAEERRLAAALGGRTKQDDLFEGAWKIKKD